MQQVGQITDFDESQGLAVDPQGNLYVADDDDVIVYVFRRGATKPFENLYAGDYVWYVNVAQNGTVYVSQDDDSSGEGGEVAVFPPGWAAYRNESTGYLKVPTQFGDVVEQLTSDAHNNVFVSNYPLADGGPPNVAEFADGRGPAKILALPVTNPHGLAVTSRGDLVVCDSDSIVTFKPGAIKPSSTIAQECGDIALWAGGSDILATVNGSGGSVDVDRYPSGAPDGSITIAGVSITSIAVDPRQGN